MDWTSHSLISPVGTADLSLLSSLPILSFLFLFCNLYRGCFSFEFNLTQEMYLLIAVKIQFYCGILLLWSAMLNIILSVQIASLSVIPFLAFKIPVKTLEIFSCVLKQGDLKA